jgi:hypothetical protein
VLADETATDRFKAEISMQRAFWGSPPRRGALEQAEQDYFREATTGKTYFYIGFFPAMSKALKRKYKNYPQYTPDEIDYFVAFDSDHFLKFNDRSTCTQKPGKAENHTPGFWVQVANAPARKQRCVQNIATLQTIADVPIHAVESCIPNYKMVCRYKAAVDVVAHGERKQRIGEAALLALMAGPGNNLVQVLST